MKKKCRKCDKNKPLAAFSKNRSSKDGHHAYCKDCATENAKAWYQRNKSDESVRVRLLQYGKMKAAELKVIVDELKSELGCATCTEDDSCCLDFHHLNDTGKDKAVSFWRASKSVDKLIREIARCVCVCSNCHRKIHAGKLQCPAKPIDRDWLETRLSDIRLKRRSPKGIAA